MTEMHHRATNARLRYLPVALAASMIAGALAHMQVGAAFAHGEECEMTLDTLAECVTYHWNDGEIYNEGVYNSLIAKVNAAVDARDQDNTEATVNILSAFISEVEALAPEQIAPEAAEHMIAHAQEALENL